jgi:predicted nucleotidyltransferase
MNLVVDSRLLDEICRRLVEHLNPRRIVLFGSRARGDSRPDSDVDLFIEMETDRPPPERAVEVSALFGLRPWSLDVVVYTPAEVARLRGVRGTLLDAIEKEGAVLYERT